ncbi:MAG: hypothetical protein OXC95_06990, partial [Dehalococcoidia bacterium]|nr:hypothetical protein [Dehalococcoidia bacterium]
MAKPYIVVLVLALAAIWLTLFLRTPNLSIVQSQEIGFGPNDINGQILNFPFGSAIDDLELPEATGGSGSYTYSLYERSSYSSVPGLNFDTSARTLAGTPSEIGEFKMVYRAEDPSSEIELEFTIVVRPGSVENIRATVDTNIPNVTLTWDATAGATKYYIDRDMGSKTLETFGGDNICSCASTTYT